MNWRHLKIVNNQVLYRGAVIAYLNKTDGYHYTVFSEKTHLAVTQCGNFTDYSTHTAVKRWIARTYSTWPQEAT
jgi:hypothetical protein